MGIVPLHDAQNDVDREPTPTELEAIEAEWPVIAAELEMLDAQLVVVMAGGHASTLDRRRIRRAERQVLAVRQAVTGATCRPATPHVGGVA
jgi:hypothetical protein